MLPEAFLAELRTLLGAEFSDFLATYDASHVTSLRINPLRKSARDEAEPFINGSVPWEPLGFYTRPNVRPGLSLAHYAGGFYLQEASAMSAAAALDIRPGMRVLDLCAAPGGKSGQILAKLGGTGLLVSNEPDPARAAMLAGNLERLGAANAAVTNAYPDQLEPLFPEYFDAILTDAPCSGEGMFRRDAGAVAEWNPGLPQYCHERQLTILESAAVMLKLGGCLVFSTCTFNTTENEGTIRAFLAEHPDFTAEDFSLPGIGASQNGCLRLWPHRLRGEGHFVCRLRKTGEPSLKKKKSTPANTAAEAQKALKLLLETVSGGHTVDLLADSTPMLRGDTLWAVPAALPRIKEGLFVMPGLRLARIGRSHAEPLHAFAMAYTGTQPFKRLDLCEEDAWRYLAGESPNTDMTGWLVITYHDMPLGWAKASGGQAKNKLPKGLRRPQGAPQHEEIYGKEDL